MSRAPFILLINPWITDFAAYDLWAKPLGLLLLASLLRQGGCGVAYVDCLEHRGQAQGTTPPRDRFGTGKYLKTSIPTPEACKGFPRHYYRYGIHPDDFRTRLESLSRPDLIWVTSVMTYWYPGVQQTISVLREVFPNTPVWLGGIYAQLCPEHARQHAGADEVVTHTPALIPQHIQCATGFAMKKAKTWPHFALWPGPALDLIHAPSYIPLLTSVGCPFQCPYCASSLLQPIRERKSAEVIADEIMSSWRSYGVRDYAFYDDALLLGEEESLRNALDRVSRENLPLRFHTPNAVHVRAISQKKAERLRKWGFETIRLGLETTRAENQLKWGGKVNNTMFAEAVSHLLCSGFRPHQIGVYLLCGLPGQSPEEVAEAIRRVQEAGVMPHIAEYSPVPGTPTWHEARRLSPYDLQGEPLYHNNTFFACRRPDFSLETLNHLKALARQVRRSIPHVESPECSHGS
ncbi:MAG: radical SAM protein [Deltaproteobacteria bacterium]|nr:radical SAM protein [Deltaproteobacteria bacterium]